MSDIKKYVAEDDLSKLLFGFETWSFVTEDKETITKNIVTSPYFLEEFVFELENGTTVTKKVVTK